jgi:hypothetical protein
MWYGGIMKAVMVVGFFLSGCSYRYGVGYFSPPDPQPHSVPPAAEVPCPEEKSRVTTMEVTNKLDSSANTIVTKAVSTTSESVQPCFY